jgi:NADP-dependent 3-hydroxy acid dehydrogenase YdfG
LVKEVSKTTDHVDILFANAGATWGEKFDTHPDSAFAKVMDLNVKSVFNTIRLCVAVAIAVAVTPPSFPLL